MQASRSNLNIIFEIDSLAKTIDMVSWASAFTVLPHISVAYALKQADWRQYGLRTRLSRAKCI